MSAQHRQWLAERAAAVRYVNVLSVHCTDVRNLDAAAAADAINACLQASALGFWHDGDEIGQAAAWDAMAAQIDACAAHVRPFFSVRVTREGDEE